MSRPPSSASLPRPAAFWDRLSSSRLGCWLRPSTLLWLSVLLPLGYVAWRLHIALRDIVYWDEFDSVLAFLNRLDAGADAREVFRRLFAWHNEHRMLTSRLLFALSYALTGKVNFIVIGVIGNLFLVLGCATLVWAMRTPLRRLQMGTVLAWTVFQLQQHENFFWSGSSIDHFQVITLGIVAMLCLRRQDTLGLVGAGACTFLATFTLAQGLAVVPAGALILALERRWRHFAPWLVWGLAVTGAFAYDFQPAVQHGALASLGPVFLYWLQLLGASPALLVKPLAELLGCGFVIWFVIWLLRGGWEREPFLASVLFFLGAALLLIAFGRAGLGDGLVSSRYAVLSSLCWALMIFAALQQGTPAVSPHWRLGWVVAGLAVFNVTSNVRLIGWGTRFAESRENAVVRYAMAGDFGESAKPLHPTPALVQKIYEEAKRRGIYQFPTIKLDFCRPVSMQAWQSSARINYFVDEVLTTDQAVFVRGWALIPELTRQELTHYLVLQGRGGPQGYTARTEQRPDVVKALKNPLALYSGFCFVLPRDRLPAEPVRLGLAIGSGRSRAIEFIMTDHVIPPLAPKAAGAATTSTSGPASPPRPGT